MNSSPWCADRTVHRPTTNRETPLRERLPPWEWNAHFQSGRLSAYYLGV